MQKARERSDWTVNDIPADVKRIAVNYIGVSLPISDVTGIQFVRTNACFGFDI
jgi:hypothetical protein